MSIESDSNHYDQPKDNTTSEPIIGQKDNKRSEPFEIYLSNTSRPKEVSRNDYEPKITLTPPPDLLLLQAPDRREILSYLLIKDYQLYMYEEQD